MFSKKVTVINKSGLHARPASVFTQTASKFTSEITIKKTSNPDFVKKAKTIISVLTMGIKLGDEIEISADGADEEIAVQTLVDLILTGFGE